MHSPTQHVVAVYHILRYLKGTPGKGLLFQKSDARGAEEFADVDWTSFVMESQSTSGFCTKLCGNLAPGRVRSNPSWHVVVQKHNLGPLLKESAS